VNVPVVARMLAMGKDGNAYVPNREISGGSATKLQ
jgi:hypothetical protein